MLFKKMLRDMKHNKMQFISIFLMAFLGVFIYVGVGSEWYGLQQTSERYYEETNLVDILIYGSNFSKADVKAVNELNGIKEVQRRLSIKATADFNNSPSIIMHFIEENKISKCLLVDGTEFSTDMDGIWLDSLFAEAHGLSVADEITVTTNGMTITKEIMGTVLNPEYVYSSDGTDLVPNHANFGFAYLSHKSFPVSNIFYTELLVTTESKDYATFEEAIDGKLNGLYNVLITRDNLESFAMFDKEVDQHKAMGAVFPIAFLAIAMLTILTTMTRMVNNQRTQIGTLKALGFRKKRILFHYVSYGLWLSLVGSLVGLITAPFTLPYLFYDAMKMGYTLPEWKPAVSPSLFIMAIVSTSICTAASYFACRNILKDTPSQTLRPQAPKAIKQSRLEKTKLWTKFGFNAKWNFRDIFRGKVRSLMAIVGVLGCTALLICAFGIQDSFADIVKWQYSDLSRFETRLILSKDASNEQISTVINDLNGESLMEEAVEIRADGKKTLGELLVIDNVTLLKFTNANRGYINLPNDGVSISYKMAKLQNIKEGDEISWHIYGDEKWVTTTIGAIYRSPLSQGITISRELFEELGYNFVPTSVITAASTDKNFEGVTQTWSTSELSESYETMTKSMNIMVYVLIIGAIILAVIVLYNLGILSFAERERELATLKVIGFKSGKIRRLLLTQNIWLTAIGIILGIPAGKWLIDCMLSFLGDSLDMMGVINVSSLIYSIIITFAVSIIVNIMFSKRIKQIDMVGALKGVE